MKSIIVFLAFFLASTSNEAQVQFGKNDYKKKLHFNGNVITFSKPMSPNIAGLHVHAIPIPKELNGENIYSTTFSTKIKPAKYIGNSAFEKYVFSAIKNSLTKLPDGNFAIFFSNFVVDKNGKLAYFDFSKIDRISKNIQVSSQVISTPKQNEESLIDLLEKLVKELQKGNNGITTITQHDSTPQYENKIYKDLYTILSKPQIKFTPANDGNKSVNSYFFVYPLLFEVAGGKVNLTDMCVDFLSSR